MLPSGLFWSAAFLFYFFLIAAILAGYAFCGFIGDAAADVAVNTHEYSTHPGFPFLSEQDTGHPLIYAWFNGFLWRWFGIRPVIASVSIWVYVALSLVALHYLTQKIVEVSLGAKAPRWAGLAAALCLLATPLFISNTAQYLSAVPHLAFSLMMLAAWYRHRRGWLTFWAFFLTFTRITGSLSVFGVGLFDLGRELYSNQCRRPRRLLVLMLPYIFCGLLFMVHLSFKLLVLERPLTTIGSNELFAGGPSSILQQIGIIIQHTFTMPRFSFSLFMIPIGFALCLSGYRKINGKRAASRNTSVATTNRTFYGGF
jgi:hypothetical protein